jgi:hypothetical protein
MRQIVKQKAFLFDNTLHMSACYFYMHIFDKKNKNKNINLKVG